MNGCELVPASTTSSTGAFCAIQFITEGGLTEVVSNSLATAESAITDFTFPAGFVLYVPFTSVSTDTGTSIVAYKSSL